MGADEFGVAAILGIGGAVLVAVLVMVACIIGTLLGAFTGWLLMWVGIAPWVYDGFAQLGLHVTNLWQVGAALGFVGGFFKASLEVKKEKD